MALCVWVLSIVAIFIFPLFLIVPYLITSGAAISEEMQNDPQVVLLGLIGVAPAHLFTFIITWFVVTNYRKHSFLGMLGWKSGGIRWWYYPLVIASFMALVGGVSQILPEREHDILRIIRSSPAAAYTLAFIATFFAPFIEEAVYRGLLYSAFQRSIGTVWTVAIVTLMFAGIHYPQYWESPGSIIMITVLSFALTMTRTLSGNLLPCVILHFLFNGLQSIFIILEPYFNLPELQQQTTSLLIK